MRITIPFVQLVLNLFNQLSALSFVQYSCLWVATKITITILLSKKRAGEGDIHFCLTLLQPHILFLPLKIFFGIIIVWIILGLDFGKFRFLFKYNRLFNNLELHDKWFFPEFARGPTEVAWLPSDLSHYCYSNRGDFLKQLSKNGERIHLIGAGSGVDISRCLASGYSFNVTLSDLFPQVEAWKKLRDKHGECLDYIEESVDAATACFPENSVVVLIWVAHHLSEETMEQIITNVLKRNCTIGIFDGIPIGPIHFCGYFLTLFNNIYDTTSHYFINNIRLHYYSWIRILLAFPFCFAVILWDHTGPSFSSYSKKDFKRIIQKIEKKHGISAKIEVKENLDLMNSTHIISLANCN